jgi:acetyl-CoA carboxylase carboxyl transferase subunit alpha
LIVVEGKKSLIWLGMSDFDWALFHSDSYGVKADERHIWESIAVNLSKNDVGAHADSRASYRRRRIGSSVRNRGGWSRFGAWECHYSVISPEGCAAILWKNRSYAPEAAEALKLTAVHLKELELTDGVIPEPPGGAHQDHELDAKNLPLPKLPRVRSVYARAAFRISSATLPSDFACLGLNHEK